MMKRLADLGPASVRTLNGVGIRSEQGQRALGVVARQDRTSFFMQPDDLGP